MLAGQWEATTESVQGPGPAVRRKSTGESAWLDEAGGGSDGGATVAAAGAAEGAGVEGAPVLAATGLVPAGAGVAAGPGRMSGGGAWRKTAHAGSVSSATRSGALLTVSPERPGA